MCVGRGAAGHGGSGTQTGLQTMSVTQRAIIGYEADGWGGERVKTSQRGGGRWGGGVNDPKWENHRGGEVELMGRASL